MHKPHQDKSLDTSKQASLSKALNLNLSCIGLSEICLKSNGLRMSSYEPVIVVVVLFKFLEVELQGARSEPLVLVPVPLSV